MGQGGMQGTGVAWGATQARSEQAGSAVLGGMGGLGREDRWHQDQVSKGSRDEQQGGSGGEGCTRQIWEEGAGEGGTGAGGAGLCGWQTKEEDKGVIRLQRVALMGRGLG